jgi:hypothetical protein
MEQFARMSNGMQWDYKAGLALLIFPLVYAGVLIDTTVANQPPPTLDPTGQPYPTLIGEALGYVVMGSLLALLGHLLVFVPFRARHRGWPLRALVPLQLSAAAGSLYAFTITNPVAAVLLAPVLVTIAVYGIAWLIARRNEERP